MATQRSVIADVEAQATVKSQDVDINTGLG